VIELQWRGIAIVLLIIADVIFFAIVFVFMDGTETSMVKDPTKAEKWLACLVATEGDKNKCLDLAEAFVVNEATVMSVLVLLSFNGIWSLIFLGRFSMFTGWYELVKSRIQPNKEFVSVDARTFKDPRSYEMLASARDTGKTPEPMITPISPVAESVREAPDYFGREARYKSPSGSFSSPKPPQGRQWDSSASHAQPTYYAGMNPLSMNKI
jgi:hypothetical protein